MLSPEQKGKRLSTENTCASQIALWASKHQRTAPTATRVPFSCPPNDRNFLRLFTKYLGWTRPQGILKDGFIEHYPEGCFSKENIENLRKQWESGVPHGIGPGVRDFMQWCLARSAVELTTGSVTTKYYSTGQNIFFDDLGNKFWIYNGWRFLWDFGNLAGDFYMMEGRCDLIK